MCGVAVDAATNRLTTVLTRLMRTEPSKAYQKLSTKNPSRNDAANKKMAALSTKVKSPSVKIVIGKVSINKTGRTIVLSTPRTIAAMSAA